jgi:hypothetical protein
VNVLCTHAALFVSPLACRLQLILFVTSPFFTIVAKVLWVPGQSRSARCTYEVHESKEEEEEEKAGGRGWREGS